MEWGGSSVAGQQAPHCPLLPPLPHPPTPHHAGPGQQVLPRLLRRRVLHVALWWQALERGPAPIRPAGARHRRLVQQGWVGCFRAGGSGWVVGGGGAVCAVWCGWGVGGWGAMAVGQAGWAAGSQGIPGHMWVLPSFAPWLACFLPPCRPTRPWVRAESSVQVVFCPPCCSVPYPTPHKWLLPPPHPPHPCCSRKQREDGV